MKFGLISITLEILWALKPKEEITKIKNQTWDPYVAKTSNWAYNLFWWGIWQTFGVCWLKVSHLRYFGRKNPKRRLQRSKTKLVILMLLKRESGLKICFGGAFDKLLVFVEILLALKHKNEITKVKNETCVSFGPKTSNWA